MDNRSRTAPKAPILTVGQEQGDLRGRDDKILQAGVEYVHRLGGGILQILPGEYAMRNALYLRPHVTIRGSGVETVLKKAASVVTGLARDSDWYENQVEVEDPSGFAPGCGIMLRSHRQGELQVVRDTVVEMAGNVISLSRRLEKNFWLQEQATAATLFPILTAEWVNDVLVQDLVLDGNMEQNEEIDGNHAGALFIQHCDRHTFENVIARNYNGDGFSWQVCDDVRLERCRSEGNAMLGFHPGSGSQRPYLRDCTARGNGQGIFFCWGVTEGVVENCTCAENRDYGISIGHRDTDNRISGCTIERNGTVGILFREPEEAFRGGHRNTIESSLIRDNGIEAEGIGVEIRGETYDVAIRNSRFEDSGEGRQRIGIRFGSAALRTRLEGNSFHSMETDVLGGVQAP